MVFIASAWVAGATLVLAAPAASGAPSAPAHVVALSAAQPKPTVAPKPGEANRGSNDGSSSPRPAGGRLPVPEPSPDASRQQAQDTLAGAEYQEPSKNFLQKAAEWVQEQLSRVMSSGGFGGFAWVILALLLGALAFGLSRIRWTRGLRREDRGYEFDLEDRRAPQEWLADAERFESRGEWKPAIRCRFRALIGELIDLGALREIPGRTTGEYRVELRRCAPAAAAPFAVASQLFESAWYGDEPTGPAESARFRDNADQAVRETRARRGAEESVEVTS